MRIISDRNSRRSKGIAYVEFCEMHAVPLAIGLSGQRLLGVPIIVQASQVGGCPTHGVSMGLYGVPMGLYGVPLGLCGVSMGLSGALWGSFGALWGVYGALWGPYEALWGSMEC